MPCQKCNSNRLCEIGGKSSDLNYGTIIGKEFNGYVPDNVGIGGGDYIEFSWCLECGQIQGEWPKKTPPKYEPDEN